MTHPFLVLEIIHFVGPKYMHGTLYPFCYPFSKLHFFLEQGYVVLDLGKFYGAHARLGHAVWDQGQKTFESIGHITTKTI